MSSSFSRYLGHGRTWLAVLAACAGCNSLFGINEAVRDTDVPDGTISCTSTADCLSKGPICLFSRCSAPCQTDSDCSSGRRCLHTQDVSACVSDAQASCAVEMPCPGGTVCSNGSCRGPDVSAQGGGGADAGAAGHGGEGGTAGTEAVPSCGDGVLDGGEHCDDGNTIDGDGCSSTCAPELHWNCAGDRPTVCTPICGDGLVLGAEAKAGGCDDGNLESGDGCSSKCTTEAGFLCSGAPSVCIKQCGNGKVDPGEQCDDKNAVAGDGCFACAIEDGFACDNHTGSSKCADIDECTSGTNNCSANATCQNKVGSFSCTCKAGYAGDGVTCVRTSCVGMSGTECQGGDCCASPTVAGGYFYLGGIVGTTPTTVSAFALDKYEVTVGRFRNFVSAYSGPPAAGAGAHPLIADSGWQTAWTIAPDSASLAAAVQCDTKYQTWDPSGANDKLPMNCVNWFEAFAFCAWDGGRLPTEAEWEYAAAGGDEQRIYPWGNTPVPDNAQDPSAAYANYDGLGDGSAAAVYSFADVLPVGSRPLGAGKWGQMDLAGSVWDWTLDWVAPYPDRCDNCANLTPSATRSLRGGAFYYDASNLGTAVRSGNTPVVHYSPIGFRCARTP